MMKGKFPTIVMAMMALVLALSLAVVGAGVQTDEAEAGDLTWSTMMTPSMGVGIYPMVDTALLFQYSVRFFLF